MDSNKSSLIYIGVAAFVVLIIIVGILLVFFGGNGDDGKSQGSESVAAGNIEVPNVKMVLPNVERDSVLRSADSGLSFETYFKAIAETEPGPVDVLSINFHPSVKNDIVISTFDDGLFSYKDNIGLWEPIMFPPQKIYSFIIDKTDPDNRAFASGVVSGNGRIFRTDDGGETWRVVYAEPGNNTYVSALTQNPVNNNIIIAGTSGGTLVRSVDGGDTWKNIGQKISGSILKFVHNNSKASVTYLLMRGGKIYHSYDEGLTWLNWEEEKTKEIKRLNDQANTASRSGDKDGAQYLKDQAKAIQERNKTEKTPSGIINIVSDPNISGVLYASLSKGLYRSTDFGKYWKPINIIESAEKFPILSVAVNPNNSDEISFVSGSTFYRSVNYGVTWAITPLDKSRNASIVTYDPFDPTIIYLGLSAKK